MASSASRSRSAATAPWWSEGAAIIHPIPATGGRRQSVRLGSTALPHSDFLATTKLLPDALGAEERARVLALASKARAARGDTRDGADYRQCVVARLLPSEQTLWLYERCAGIFATANGEFGFDLIGMVEPLMVVGYGPGDHFDWHLDTGPELSAYRKLSMSVLVSGPDEYAGGELEFCASGGTALRPAAGAAIVFPSYLAHRVHPVRGGKRIALVAFAYGPSFQ